MLVAVDGGTVVVGTVVEVVDGMLVLVWLVVAGVVPVVAVLGAGVVVWTLPAVDPADVCACAVPLGAVVGAWVELGRVASAETWSQP